MRLWFWREGVGIWLGPAVGWLGLGSILDRPRGGVGHLHREYGYYAAPDYNLYGNPDQGYYGSNNYSAPPPQQYGQDDQYDQENSTPDGNWITPNGPSPSSAPSSAALAVPVLIYMKSGSVLTVRDYWMVDGELHYILVNGAQSLVNLEQV